MDKTYTKIVVVLLLFVGVWSIFVGSMRVNFDMPIKMWGYWFSVSAWWVMVRGCLLGWLTMLFGVGAIGTAILLDIRMNKVSLEIESIDLVLDDDDPMRCHLIKAGEGIINSGTWYFGEDGEPHIKWDKPRERRPWDIYETVVDLK